MAYLTKQYLLSNLFEDQGYYNIIVLQVGDNII